MADHSPTAPNLEPDPHQARPDRPEPVNSRVERAFSGRVPPADAETTPGDATPHVDVHHRDHNTNKWDFVDKALEGHNE